MPHTLPRYLIFLPARSRQIAASDAFDVDHLGPPHKHRAAFELIRERLQLRRIFIDIGGDQMIRNQGPKPLQPEQGHLIQYSALVWDSGGKNIVESGDPVCGDDQQIVADPVNIPHLAAADPLQAGQISVEKD